MSIVKSHVVLESPGIGVRFPSLLSRHTIDAHRAHVGAHARLPRAGLNAFQTVMSTNAT